MIIVSNRFFFRFATKFVLAEMVEKGGEGEDTHPDVDLDKSQSKVTPILRKKNSAFLHSPRGVFKSKSSQIVFAAQHAPSVIRKYLARQKICNMNRKSASSKCLIQI